MLLNAFGVFKFWFLLRGIIENVETKWDVIIKYKTLNFLFFFFCDTSLKIKVSALNQMFYHYHTVIKGNYFIKHDTNHLMIWI